MRTIYPLIIAVILVYGCRKKEDPPTLPPPSPKVINGFSFMKTDNPSLAKDFHASVSDDSIFFYLPKGAAVSTLIPTVDYEGASLTPSSKTAQDFSQPVLYTVKAIDGSTRTYKASVRIQDTAKTMTSFIFKKADNPSLDQDIVGIITGDSISAIPPKSADVENLKPTIVYTGSSVNPGNVEAYDFRNLVTYTVNAEDSSMRTYRVFTGYRSDIFAVSNDYFLYDLDAFNGAVRWKYQVGTGSTPTYANGIVYIAGPNSEVYAIDAITGTLKWKSTPPPGNFSLGLPVAKYGKIYFGGSGYLTDPGGYAHFAAFVYCLNAETGTTEWLKEFFPDFPYYHSRHTNVVVEDNIACIFDNATGTYAFNAADGTPIWKITGEILAWSNPAIANGNVCYGIEFGFIMLNVTNGQQLWRILDHNSYTSPSISNNIIFTTFENTVIAYNTNSTVKWQTTYGDGLYSPVVVDNSLYVCDRKKRLLAFNAENGSFKWSREQYNQYPVIANNNVYVTDPNNRINCLDAATGNFKWLTENVVTFPFAFCVVDGKGNARHIADSGGQN